MFVTTYENMSLSQFIASYRMPFISSETLFKIWIWIFYKNQIWTWWIFL